MAPGARWVTVRSRAPLEITRWEISPRCWRSSTQRPAYPQQTIRAQGKWDAPGGDWVRSVVADHGIMIGPAGPLSWTRRTHIETLCICR
jgi:hypothetical protein